jgi:glycosyltransferase involved in cell wall biosynthesis
MTSESGSAIPDFGKKGYDRDMPKVSVVMPARDEADALVSLLPEIREVMDSLEVSYEVIVVDDGSRDGTIQVLEDFSREWPNLKGVVLGRSVGQTAALQAAFDNSQGVFVVTLDADGQNDPADIPLLLRKLEEGFDLVTGWRVNRKDANFSKRIPSRFANTLIRHLARTTLHDQGCALKAIRADLLKDLRIYGEQHRYIAVLAETMGARIAEIPVNHRSRQSGMSHYGFCRVPKVVLDLMFLKYIASYSQRPLHLFGGGGLLSILIGMVICATVTLDKIMGLAKADRPLLLLGVMLIMLGGILLMLGILAELIVRTHHESTGTPVYRIQRRIERGE